MPKFSDNLLITAYAEIVPNEDSLENGSYTDLSLTSGESGSVVANVNKSSTDLISVSDRKYISQKISRKKIGPVGGRTRRVDSKIGLEKSSRFRFA